MGTINRGNAAEAIALAALGAADIPALIPFGQGLPFDVAALVPPTGELLRIQVKCGRVRAGCVRFNTCSTDHGKGRQSYEGRPGVIAVHVPELSRLFVLPVDDCPSYLGLLRPDPPRNNQRCGIRFAADYEFDHWLESVTGAEHCEQTSHMRS